MLPHLPHASPPRHVICRSPEPGRQTQASQQSAPSRRQSPAPHTVRRRYSGPSASPASDQNSNPDSSLNLNLNHRPRHWNSILQLNSGRMPAMSAPGLAVAGAGRTPALGEVWSWLCLWWRLVEKGRLRMGPGRKMWRRRPTGGAGAGGGSDAIDTRAKVWRRQGNFNQRLGNISRRLGLNHAPHTSTHTLQPTHFNLTRIWSTHTSSMAYHRNVSRRLGMITPRFSIRILLKVCTMGCKQKGRQVRRVESSQGVGDRSDTACPIPASACR